MLSDLYVDVPRVVALIDLSELRWQVKRIGGASEPDLTAVLEHVEAGLVELDPPSPQAGPALGERGMFRYLVTLTSARRYPTCMLVNLLR